MSPIQPSTSRAVQEIADLIRSERQMRNVDKTLKERDDLFKGEFSKIRSRDAVGFWITAVPADSRIQLGQLYENEHVSWNVTPLEPLRPQACTVFEVTDSHEKKAINEVFVDEQRLEAYHWFPVLRSLRGDVPLQVPDTPRSYYGYAHLSCEGIVELRWLENARPEHGGTPLYSYSVVQVLARVLCWVNRVRSQAGDSGTEYVIQCAVHATSVEKVEVREGRRNGIKYGMRKHFINGSAVLPKSSFRDAADELLRTLNRDLCNAAGFAPSGNVRFKIDCGGQ